VGLFFLGMVRRARNAKKVSTNAGDAGGNNLKLTTFRSSMGKPLEEEPTRKGQSKRRAENNREKKAKRGKEVKASSQIYGEKRTG